MGSAALVTAAQLNIPNAVILLPHKDKNGVDETN